jgi:hypothetical protein
MQMLYLYDHLCAVVELCSVSLTNGSSSQWLFIKARENFRKAPNSMKIRSRTSCSGRAGIDLQGLKGFLECCGKEVPHDGKVIGRA